MLPERQYQTHQPWAHVQDEGESLHSTVQRAFEANDGALALQMVDRLLDGNPVETTHLLIQRAEALRLLHRLDEAEQIVKQVLKRDGGHAEAHYVRARCQFDAGRMEEGWRSIKSALAADPSHPKARRLRRPLL